MNIIQWLLENNHAKAQRHAENIIVLLKLNELYDLKDDAGIIARVELYEAWKKSGMYDKKDRAACAMKAIAGEPVPAPVVDMFAPIPDSKDDYMTDAEAQDIAKIEDVIIQGGTILSWGMGEE